ncbi:MAG: alanine racemase, partial [Spirochaeta sp.]|nr:alanine racemase [Spirochaeta sp.]
MSGPILTVDLQKIEKNARAVVSICREHNITVAGVTKATCGMPQVARAMFRGGIQEIGESRLENIHRFRASGINCPLILLRIPPLSEVDEIVASVDISLNSELSVIKGLSVAAERRGIVHEIILMLDLGDLREGIWPDDLMPMAREIVELSGVRIVGIGTNLTCFGGVIPTSENMGALVEYARALEDRFSLKLRYISGGNSSSLPLLASGKMPEAVNHLRIGEAILLGRETVHRNPWPGTFQDAFLLSSELIELKEKPSLPVGEIGEDAFGFKGTFEDRGNIIRGILNIGREDVNVEGLKPVDRKLTILGASSDHLLLDVTAAGTSLKLGDRVFFEVNYSALLSVMTSAYVQKKAFLSEEYTENASSCSGVFLSGDRGVIDAFMKGGLEKKLGAIGYRVFEAEESITSPSGIELALSQKKIPLILGSDHTMSLTGFLGLSGQVDAFGLIWFDSKAGFSPPGRVEKQGQGRSALAAALGYGTSANFGELRAHLSPENTVIIGLRAER